MVDLNGLKNYLNITWDDESTDAKLKSLALRAQSAVNNLIGAAAVFFTDDTETDTDTASPQEEQLFLDCCRYIYHGAYEDFQVNFAPEITSLRVRRAVQAIDGTEG